MNLLIIEPGGVEVNESEIRLTTLTTPNKQTYLMAVYAIEAMFSVRVLQYLPHLLRHSGRALDVARGDLCHTVQQTYCCKGLHIPWDCECP
jgi:hypothetical protein